MSMIVREMILLDQASFQRDDPHDLNDDSGWLGPPRAVPFAWELAPGTPKQERKPAPEEEDEGCRAIVKVGSPGDVRSWREEQRERNSIHILDNAPSSFLVSRNSEVAGEFVVDRLSKGRAVAFKWEMEPGIPRDPSKRPDILDCPLTPPPVLHSSRSMVVHSSPIRKPSTLSLSQRLRSLLWIQPLRKHHHHRRQQQQQQQDFRMRLHPHGRTTPTLLLKNSPHNASSSSLGSKKSAAGVCGVGHSDEEDDLSPVSVLDYSGSIRSSGGEGNGNNKPRLSSASASSRRSHYHTPQHSFSSPDAAANLSLSGSFKSAKNTGSTRPRGSLSTLLLRRSSNNNNMKTGMGGCFTMPRSNSLSTTNDSFEEAVSEVNSSSERSSSLSSDVSAENRRKKLAGGNCGESSDDDARSVYYSPAPHDQSSGQSPRQSFSFPSGSAAAATTADDRDQPAASKGRSSIDRVDSLETIDPGFAPSEIDDDQSYQHSLTILNRMTSCAGWQRRQAATIKQRSSGQLARSLFGRVTVCCYVPREDQC